MNKRNTIRTLAAAVLLGAPLSLSASGLRLASQDAFATARGEAFVATADNASAVYYNPAGIAWTEHVDVRFGAYGIYYNPGYTPPGTQPNADRTYHITNKVAVIPQFFLALTPRDLPLSFGVGSYSPYGLGGNWPQDTGFRSVATIGSLTYETLNPVVSIKLAPGLSIGGGVMANYVKMDMESGLKKTFTPVYPDYFSFTGNGWSVGYNLGLLWQVREEITIGATYRSESRVSLEGDTEFERLPHVHHTIQSAAMDLTFPMTAVFGISYRPTPAWNIEFDADYTDWSSFKSMTIKQAAAVSILQKDIILNLGWQPSWMYELGATRYLDGGWHVSGGYIYSQSSVPDTYYTPLVADVDRHFFTVGAGRKGSFVDFDLAFQLGYGPGHTVTDSTPSTAGRISGQSGDGTYDFISYALLLTAGFHF
jgi:long-chain fatty acid transport protein